MAYQPDPRPTTFSIIYDMPSEVYIVRMGDLPISHHKTLDEAKAAKKRCETRLAKAEGTS